MKDIFEPVGMTEDKFWELVGLAKWPEMPYEDTKIIYLKKLNKKECSNFRKSVHIALGLLDIVAARNIDGIGDDGYGDLLNHVIGKGKTTFYKCLKNVKLMQKMADDRDYKECFGYCIPYESDYKEDGDYSISHVKGVATKALAEIKTFKKMDPDEKFLSLILGHMNLMECIFKTFLKDVDTNTNEALARLIEEKAWVDKHCKAIEKFFESNYMELPRKFTENGHNGICTALFTNTCHDAEKVMKFLS